LGREDSVTADAVAFFPIELADVTSILESWLVSTRGLEGDAGLASDDWNVSLRVGICLIVHN
jgi:hypothetical protein